MEKRPEKLKELTELVCSSNYKERFLGEYWSLKLRAEKLAEIIKRWEEGALTFAPICSKDILKEQLSAMQNYLIILEKRAKIENIVLTPYLRNGATFVLKYTSIPISPYLKLLTEHLVLWSYVIHDDMLLVVVSIPPLLIVI